MERSIRVDNRESNMEPSSLRGFFAVLSERKWWFMGPLIILIGLSLAYTSLATPQYKAQALLLRQSTKFDQALFQTQVFELTDPARALQTGADLVKLDVVAGMVKQDLNSSRTVKKLSRMVEVTPNSATDIIAVTATSTDPGEAVLVADAFARQFILYRMGADRTIIEQARQKIVEQMATMSAAEKATDQGKILIQRGEDLAILESMQTGGYEVVQQATVPSIPSSPRSVLILSLAVIVGLVAGLALSFAVHLLNRRIRDEETLERELGVPVLTSVPVLGRRWRLPQGRISRRPDRLSAPSISSVGALSCAALQSQVLRHRKTHGVFSHHERTPAGGQDSHVDQPRA